MLRTYEQRAADCIRAMERDGIAFSFDRLKSAVFNADTPGWQTPVVSFIRSIRDDLRARGRHGNSNFYHAVSNAVEQFRPGATLADLDGAWIAKFERWLTAQRELTPGGLSVLLRTFRAACNRAIAEKICPRSWYPFQDYSLAHLKSRKAKKAAGLDFIRAMEACQLSGNTEQLARDLFLFSFYCRGMNLADIAELTPAHIHGGRIVYTRKKTGRVYSVPVSEKAAAIIARYAGGVRLFPVYLSQKTDAQKHYRRNKVSRQINLALREIAAALGFEIPGLSFYTARHTYATGLKEKGVSVEVISQALGHADIRTTDAYLKSFGDEVLDAADRLLE